MNLKQDPVAPDDPDSSEYPSLPSRPDMARIVPQTFKPLITRIPHHGVKRSMQEGNQHTADLNLHRHDTNTNPQPSPSKNKVIKLDYSYRDPTPNLGSLPSLDSDSLDFNFESPSLDSSKWNLSSNLSGTSSDTLGSMGLSDLMRKSPSKTKSLHLGNMDNSSSSPAFLFNSQGSNSSDLNFSSRNKHQTIEIHSDQSNPTVLEDINSEKRYTPTSFGIFSSLKNTKPESRSNNIPALTTNDSNKLASQRDNDNADISEFREIPEGDTQILQKMKKCRKNPKHESFILPKNVQVSDLPREIQHEDSVTFLACMAQLVVQITVHSTSDARKADDENRSCVGTTKKRNGSGFISSVDGHIQRFRCKRENCPHSVDTLDSSALDKNLSSLSSPQNVTLSPNFDRSISNISSSSDTSFSPGNGKKHYYYGGVNIHTNRHIIYDKLEADNAYVKFFFNTPDSKDVIHGHVGSIIGVNDFQDHITLHVMSHDKTLFQKIEGCLANAKSSYDQMLQSTVNMQKCFSQNPLKSWVCVISHPHGLAKHVTVGRIRKEVVEARRVKKFYDADTCPGSSGGLVITPTLLRQQWPGAVHSLYDNETRCNATFDARCPEIDADNMKRIHKSMVSSSH